MCPSCLIQRCKVPFHLMVYALCPSLSILSISSQWTKHCGPYILSQNIWPLYCMVKFGQKNYVVRLSKDWWCLIETQNLLDEGQEISGKALKSGLLETCPRAPQLNPSLNPSWELLVLESMSLCIICSSRLILTQEAWFCWNIEWVHLCLMEKGTFYVQTRRKGQQKTTILDKLCMKMGWLSLQNIIKAS